MKKRNKFKIILTVYISILLVLSASFIVYLNETLKEYEIGNPTSFIKYELSKLSNKKIRNYFNLTDNNKIEEYKKMLTNKNNIIKLKSKNLYEVFNKNDYKLCEVEIKSKGKISKIGLLNYEVFDLDKIVPYMNRGLSYYDIVVPSNYSVYINNKKLDINTSLKKDKYENLKNIYDYIDTPYIIKYEVNDLLDNDKIIIKNQFEENVKFKNNNIINLSLDFKTFNNIEDLKKYINFDIDPVEFAKNWSLFMSKDLSGNNYGFSNISEYLVTNSYVYNLANSWVKSIDINYVNSHILKSPIFTNEKVSNCKLYSKDIFSCDIYLEKNMKMDANPKLNLKERDLVDTLNETIYFINYNGKGWKVINLESVVEGEKNE